MPAKADVLKQYEVYGYRIAMYLLGDEASAAEAAKDALAELYRTDAFFRQPSAQQMRTAKQAFMRHSLSTKASSRSCLS
ncbi:hypothetical protein FE782_27235 [Paenibacillus antri]|uniref:RNA polymerase sigma-70 region 2 domain-containing protein n=1 Tax=Paenibacillus antri TaxID=2582848 RepID=A0A5R9FYK4_9BACL|nr:hypothetical protein [Paenibacillus antri]TLS49137.1 hypothetical protein FE782_27235 [Paenibacillus antri]